MTAEPDDVPRVHRLTGADLMQWQSDVGPVPQHVAAVLLLDGPRPPAGALVAVLRDRLGAVPALGRRPVRAPLGCGGWYWADDDRDPAAHVGVERVPGDDVHDVLDAATRCLLERLPAGRSPWRARVLVGPDGAPVALVVVLHHVLADGVTGLALLGTLVDGPHPTTAPARPVPVPPGRAALVREAWARRLRAPGRLPSLLRA
ncbi:wax ester/triacylglycerol synthase domain-containing protein, partial [Kineosporia sp. R_H_3]|uniref:wax ester/triacylglycerol synthase domain-containing protein n=1 Tax=Kineosporia sp. R_H_3 TaxID=1961848 RepID=UPI0018E97F5D